MILLTSWGYFVGRITCYIVADSVQDSSLSFNRFDTLDCGTCCTDLSDLASVRLEIEKQACTVVPCSSQEVVLLSSLVAVTP
jgi:hypothetical protein